MKIAFRPSIFVLLLVLALLPGGLRGGSGPVVSEASGQLTVLEWPDLEGEDYWIDFRTKYPNVTVDFVKKESDAAIYSAIILGERADIIHPYTSWLKQWVKDGLVQAIAVDDLTNWKKVPDELKLIGRFTPEGGVCRVLNEECKQYFIPWDVGFSSILYRTDRVKGINSWKDLFDVRYKGHISMFDDGPSAVSVSSYINNYDETNITPEEITNIKDEWIKQKELNVNYWNDESNLVRSIVDGEVWVAYAWPSAYARLKEEMPNVKFEYADPKEGRASWVGAYGILTGSKNPDDALNFLDEKLSTKTAENVINKLGYGVANEDVWRSSSNSTLKELSLLDPIVLQQTNFTPELTAEQRDAYTEMWADVRAELGLTWLTWVVLGLIGIGGLAMLWNQWRKGRP